MALEKEESFYSASEEADELKGDKGIYVRRKSSTSADVKPKVILEHAGREGERVQSTSVVLEEEKPRPLARRKSQLGRDLQASISNSKPIPPLRTEDHLRDEVENNDSKMPSASTSARVGPEAADKVNGVGASAKISAGTIFVGDEPYFLFCEKCHGHVQTVRHTVFWDFRSNTFAVLLFVLSPHFNPYTDQSVDRYLVETTLNKAKEIGRKIRAIQLSLVGERDGLAEKPSPAPQSKTSPSEERAAGDATQYEVLESLMQVLNAVNQVDDMLLVKNEMFTLVQENHRLRVKALQREKEKDVEVLERRLAEERDRHARERKKLEVEREGWSKEEKRKVLEDFNHLKSLYEKDRRRMEGLIEDLEGRLRSASISQQFSQQHFPYNGPVLSPTLASAGSGRISDLRHARGGPADLASSGVPPLALKRHSVASFSPQIHAFQDRVQSNLSLSPSLESLRQLNGSPGLEPQINGDGNGSMEMMDLVDMLTAENTKLRQIMRTSSPASSH